MLSLKEKNKTASDFLLSNCPQVLNIFYGSPVEYYFWWFWYMIRKYFVVMKYKTNLSFFGFERKFTFKAPVRNVTLIAQQYRLVPGADSRVI